MERNRTFLAKLEYVKAYRKFDMIFQIQINFLISNSKYFAFNGLSHSSSTIGSHKSQEEHITQQLHNTFWSSKEPAENDLNIVPWDIFQLLFS